MLRTLLNSANNLHLPKGVIKAKSTVKDEE